MCSRRPQAGAAEAERWFTFEAGREYLVRWSTCLPPDFGFDSRQPEGIGQIHEGAPQDRGRWVQWTLRCRPDSSGARVLSATGIPNAYPNDSRAYFKIGIYKWWWKQRPSDVAERTMFFGASSLR